MNNAKKAAVYCAYAGSLVTVVPVVNGNVGLATNVGLQQNHLHPLLEPLLEQPVVFDIPRGGGSSNDDSSHPKNKAGGSSTQDEHQRSRSNRKKSSSDKKKKSSKDQSSSSETSKASPQQEQESTNPVLEEILQQENYYKMLGLMQGESDVTKIKKAYRRRAVQTHPDKTGGDRRAFDKVAEAYDVLSDDNKRSLYNQFGKKGVQAHEEGGPSTTTAESLFRSFFGSSSPFFRGHQEDPHHRQQQPVRYQLETTLEELYQGATRSVFVAQPPANTNSQEYFQQAEPKKIQVSIPRGTLSGSTIVVTPKDIDGAPTDWEDDLLFWVKQRPHSVFTRKNHDLAIQVHISLQEAINGVTRSIVHLDGQIIHLGSARQKIRHFQQHPTEDAEAPSDDPPSQYIQSGDVHVWKGKGMPKDTEGKDFGDLYVQYHVEIPRAGHPEKLTPEERQELARLLQKYEGRTIKQNHIKKSKKKDAADIHYLERASIADFGRVSASGPEDGHRHHDQHDQQQQHHHSFPFGGHRQFFFSSTGGSGPYFGQETNFEEDDNVQCRSM